MLSICRIVHLDFFQVDQTSRIQLGMNCLHTKPCVQVAFHVKSSALWLSQAWLTLFYALSLQLEALQFCSQEFGANDKSLVFNHKVHYVQINASIISSKIFKKNTVKLNLETNNSFPCKTSSLCFEYRKFGLFLIFGHKIWRPNVTVQ